MAKNDKDTEDKDKHEEISNEIPSDIFDEIAEPDKTDNKDEIKTDEIHIDEIKEEIQENKEDLQEQIEKEDIKEDLLEQDELLEIYEKNDTKRYKRSFNYILYSKRLLLGVVLVASVVGLYGGYLIFGNTSLEVLWQLNQQRQNMIDEVEQSKIQNAILQKKLLELQSLEPKSR